VAAANNGAANASDGTEPSAKRHRATATAAAVDTPGVASGRPLGQPIPTGAPLLAGSERDEALAVFRAMWGAGNDIKHNPSPNPVSIERRDLEGLAGRPYLVAEKTDGVRHGLVLYRSAVRGGRPTAVMIDRALRCYDISEPEPGFELGGAPRATAPALGPHVVVCVADHDLYKGTLIDGELVHDFGPAAVIRKASARDDDQPYDPTRPDLAAGGEQPTLDLPYDPEAPALDAHCIAPATPTDGSWRLLFAAFDAPCVRGVSQRGRAYADRLADVSAMIDPPHGVIGSRLVGAAEPAVPLPPRPTLLRMDLCSKRCYPARCIDTVMERAKAARHATDGLLFTRADDTEIRTGSSWNQYKWKEQHTVDLELCGTRLEALDGIDGAEHDPEAAGIIYDAGALGRWCLDLRYLSADFTVARAGRHRSREAATVRSACDGFETRARWGRNAHIGQEQSQRHHHYHHHRGHDARHGRPDHQRHHHHHHSAARQQDEGLAVCFVPRPTPALQRLLQAVTRQTARTFSCFAEFAVKLSDAATPDGRPLVQCDMQRMRPDKAEPNNSWTIDRTLVNAAEAISYGELRRALLGQLANM
jgi:hypothetical protein